MQEILFVGGVLDGKRMCVPAESNTYVLPFSAERLVTCIPAVSDSVVRVQGSVEAWHSMDIYARTVTHRVMAYQGLTSSEVVAMLIAKY